LDWRHEIEALEIGGAHVERISALEGLVKGIMDAFPKGEQYEEVEKIR